MPSANGESVWVRITAGTNGGPFATATRRILAEESEYPPCDPLRLSYVHHNTIIEAPGISLFPNPATEAIHVQVKNIENSPYEIAILNIFGQAVRHTAGCIDTSRQKEVVINIADLPSGYYWINFQNEHTSKTLEFTCMR